MKAVESRQEARDALLYMARETGRDHRDGLHGGLGGAGYAWATLAHIAGVENLPLPWGARPPRREHSAYFAAGEVQP